MSGELEFIAALRGIASHPAARGLADDAAVLEVDGTTLVLTHDMMSEGVHWLAGQDRADVAWKLVAVNLSDLAAKGAEPLGVLLGYTLDGDDSRFIAGLREVTEQFAVPLLGGDTIRSHGPATYGLTAIGRATHRPVPSRGGARPGDGVWLGGPIGGAMLGFEALRAGVHGDVDTLAFRRPVPCLEQGRGLAPLVTAMMDVSDGLLLDSSRLATASGVTLRLASDLIPFARGIREGGRCADAMRWGDDYQLLFTLPPGVAAPDCAWRIGDVGNPGDAAVLLDGVAPDPGRAPGYVHAAPQ